MLIVLLILAAVNLIVSLIAQVIVKKQKREKIYFILSIIQGAVGGAMVGLLAILVLKGYTL
ncbi:hypothetical protein [Enterococcus sp. UD-01]|uniref:hypothetical protein n=1 Tax=Enterococcus sp. UD-01 TaxID=3373911 RepID=UPI0038326AAD